MNQRVQIIISPAGDRLAVMPEEDYLMLLAASEDEEGEPTREFLTEIERRSRSLAKARTPESEKR